MDQPIPIWLFQPESNMYFMQWYAPVEFVVQETTPQESKKKREAKQSTVDQEEKKARYEAAKQRVAAARKIARQETGRLKKLRTTEAEKMREKTMRDLAVCQREARTTIARDAEKIFQRMVKESEKKNHMKERTHYGHGQVEDEDVEKIEEFEQ